MLAQIELQKGQIALSREHLQHALKLDSNNTDALEMLAMLDHPKDELAVENLKNKGKINKAKKKEYEKNNEINK